MVTYYLGNIGAKRRSFRAMSDEKTLSIDNDEVVADFVLDGKVYFVVGEIPGAEMTVAQFLAYTRSLKTRLPLSNSAIREMLKKAGGGVRMHAKMSSLSRIMYRRVQLAAKAEDTVQTVYVNFDGIAYSSRCSRLLKKTVARWAKLYEVHVGVSDSRYVPKKAACEVFLPDGRMRGTVCQFGKRISRVRFKWALSRHGMNFSWKKIKSIVLNDN